MSLIKKINQYLDNNWKEFVLDANTLNLEEYDKQIKETYIEPLETKNTEQDTIIETKVNKSGDTVTGILNVEGSITLPNSPTTPDTHTVDKPYTMRVTANGEQEVVDGSMTEISEIEGSTVRCENLFDKSLAYYEADKDFANCTDIVVSDDKNVVTMTGNEGEGDHSWSSGWFRPLYYATTQGETAGIVCKAGDVITVSADITLITQGARSAEIRLLANNNGAGVHQVGGYTVTTTKKRYVWTTEYSIDINEYPLFTINSNRVRFENIMISKNGVTEYIPYFSDLKHANISAIKSTGRNLLNLDLGLDNLLSKNNDGSYTLTYGSGINDRFSKWFPVDIKAGTYYYQSQLLVDTTTDTQGGIASQFIYADGTIEGRSFWGNANWTWEFTKDAVSMRLCLKNEAENWAGKYKTFKLWLSYVSSNDNIEPYTEDVYQLPETLELGKWDSFNPQTGEIIRQTRTFTLNPNNVFYNENDSGEIVHFYYYIGSGADMAVETNEVNAVSNLYKGITNAEAWHHTNGNGLSASYNYIRIYDASFVDLDTFKDYLTANPLTVSYKLATPTIEKIYSVPVGYTVWNNGSETITNDNDIYGAIPTIAQTYAIHENPTEAASKAYVNNGLAKKLDKTGGTVTGSLIVENGTDTTLPALVVRNNDVTYGLTYEGDAYKLGQGTVDENGDFSFNEGEGLPVALRDDSSTFADGELVVWSADGNKLISAKVTLDDINKVVRLI